MKKHLRDLFPPLDPLRLTSEFELPMAWRRLRKRGAGDLELAGSDPAIVITNCVALGIASCTKSTRLRIGEDLEEHVSVETTNNVVWTGRTKLIGSIAEGDDLITISRRDGEGRVEMADRRILTLGQMGARTTLWWNGRVAAQIAKSWKDNDKKAGILLRTGVAAEFTDEEAIRLSVLLILTQYDHFNEGG